MEIANRVTFGIVARDGGVYFGVYSTIMFAAP